MSPRLPHLPCLIIMLAIGFVPVLQGVENQVTVRGDDILFNGKPTKILGLRCSNALISDKTTDELIEALDLYQSYGLNTLSVYFMGSRFGDVKGYRPDGSLDPVYRNRLERILRATDQRAMITIVGCLYWSTSKAKEELTHWQQADANRAIAATARWLAEKRFLHVILDPDNEGMAVRANDWSTESLIHAAHTANPELVVANNTRQDPPNEDLNMHFGKPEAGKPWFDSEATPANTPGNYWGAFSKETHQKNEAFLNYSRIGRYTVEMKEEQCTRTRDEVQHYNGFMLASTWLQCAPIEGEGGPFTRPGGRSSLGSNEDKNAEWNIDIDTLHADAGILWWLEFVREQSPLAAPSSRVDKLSPVRAGIMLLVVWAAWVVIKPGITMRKGANNRIQRVVAFVEKCQCFPLCKRQVDRSPQPDRHVS